MDSFDNNWIILMSLIYIDRSSSLIDYGLIDWTIVLLMWSILYLLIEQLIFGEMINLLIYWTAMYLFTNWVVCHFFKCMFNFNKHAMTKNASWCTAVSFISNNLGFIRIFYNNVFWVKIHVAIKQNAVHIIRCLCGIVSFLYIWLSSYVKGN